MANLINLFNPQRIIPGGWVGLLLGEHFLPELTRETKRYALRQPFEATCILVSQLGRDAASLGAARLVLEAFLASAGKPEIRHPDCRKAAQASQPIADMLR